MSAYTTQASITGRIPLPLLINALDDGNQGGQLNTAQLNQIISDVSSELDGYLASVYPVPWQAGSVPPAVANAALALVCEAIVNRRLAPPQVNPWADEAEKWRSIMKGYGEGIGNLGPNFIKQVTPGLVTQEWMSMDMNTA